MKLLGKINHIDNTDKAIGISLPFNGKGVFNKTYDTKTQIKSNLINLLLTYKGERIENPEFGADLPRLLFEPIDDILYDRIKNNITNNVRIYIPQVLIGEINIDPDEDNNTIIVNIKYKIVLSNTLDEINIEIK